MSGPRVFFSCAELSADMHLAKLAQSLRQLKPDVQIEGIGGASMRDAGVLVHHETVRKARVGLGAFARTFEIVRILRWTRRRFAQTGPPQLMVCCDSWTMNKHFLRLARQFRVPTLYYVSPQVWASREGRIRRMRRDIDRMAVILPFEESWLRQRGVDAAFVGHPLFDELPALPPPQRDPQACLPGRPAVVALISGSRRKVVCDNLPRQLEAARLIRAVFPDARFVCPTVDATHEIVLKMTRGVDWVTVRQDSFNDLVTGADAAICVSGTATLHTAALGVPLVAVFYAQRWQWHLIGRWLIKTRTFALVNWLHPQRKHIVPEIIPWHGDARPVAGQVLEWLRDPAKLKAQRAAQNAVVDPLRKRGASENAARIIVEMLHASAAEPAR